MNWRAFIAALALALLAIRPASAHGMLATITLTPASPQPGQPAELLVRLVDPYNNPLEEARVEASAGPIDEPPPAAVPLKQTEPGNHRATLAMPTAVVGTLRIIVTMPDDKWQALVPIRLGEDWFKVQEMAVDLQMIGAPKTEPVPPQYTGGAPLPPQRPNVTPTPGAQPGPTPAQAPGTAQPPAGLRWAALGGGAILLAVALLALARRKRAS